MLTVVLVGPREDAKGFGEWAEDRLREETAVFFIGVDGGLDVLQKAGMPVGLAIGDWDSLSSKKALKEVSHVTLKSEKNVSDFRAALDFAKTLKADKVIAYGFQGGHLDQELGVLTELKNFAGKFHELEWIGSRAFVSFLNAKRGSTTLLCAKGTRFSVYPVEPAASGVTLAGAQYPLKNAKLLPSSLGLSNVAKGDVKVSVKRGSLMVVCSHEE